MAVAPLPSVSLYLPTEQALFHLAISAVVQRGRRSPLFDEFDVGTATVVFNNETRILDPLYAAGTYFGDLVPGQRARIRCTPSGGSAATIIDGSIDDLNLEYPDPTRSVASVTLTDALAILGEARFDEWTSTYGDYPGARLTAALARPEIAYAGTTAFDTGVTPLQEDLVTWGSNVLNYAQLVARTDFGYFFADRANVITFYDRLHFLAAASAITFGTGGVPFQSVQMSTGKELLFNYVQIGRVPGPFEEEDPAPSTASDPTSIAAYGNRPRTLSYDGLLMQSDTLALALAENLVDVYKDPLSRFESITIALHGANVSTAQQATILALDIGSVVRVRFTPHGLGGEIDRTCIVEGIRHSLMPTFHEVTLTLGDSSVVATGDYFEPNSGANGAFAGSVQTFPFPPF